jgi:hypothetical protein
MITSERDSGWYTARRNENGGGSRLMPAYPATALQPL